MKRLIALTLAVLALAACKQESRKSLLPNVSGKAGEVVVVLDKANWEGALGEEVRGVLAADCPFLPIREPLYSLVNVIPSGFSNLFKVHRNIVQFIIDPQGQNTGIEYLKNAWADPQCLIRVCAPDAAKAGELFTEQGDKITSYLEQSERDRVIRNTIRYEQRDIFPKVAEVFGGSLHFPAGYQLRKITDDFAWIQYDRQNSSTQGILIYKYPAEEGVNEFDLDRIITKRNEYMKANVPGMFEGTYMTTGGPQDFPPYVEYIKYKGREFAQTRGLWEVEGDFMGGPFVSETFYSKDGKDIIVTEAFIYYPNKDKRLYLRQVESLLYSWEWKKEVDKK